MVVSRSTDVSRSVSSYSNLVGNMSRRNSISPQKQIDQNKKSTIQNRNTSSKAMNQRPPQSTYSRRTTAAPCTTARTTAPALKRTASSAIPDSRQLKRPRTIQTEAEKRKELVAKAKEKIKELEDSMQEKTQQYENEIQEGKKKFQKELEEKENELLEQSSRFKRDIQRKQQEIEDLKTEHERQMDLEQRSFKRRFDDLKRLNLEISDKVKDLERDLSKEKNEKDIALNNILELQKEHLRESSNMKRTIDSQKITIEHTSQVSEERRQKIESLEEQLKGALENIEKLKELRIMDEQQRRLLHNQIQELKGNIRVYCRVRPLLPHEAQDNNLDHIAFSDEVDQKEIVITKDPTLSAMGKELQGKALNFSFDKTFRPEATQEEVFEEISQLVTSAIDGYKVCIFAYGQTGAGKTYTMEGSSTNFEQRGMIPRSVEKIFATTDYMRKQGWEYRVQASFLEIYNETLRDLLDSDTKKKLEIKHLKDGNTTVTDLSYVPVDGPKKVYELLKQSLKNRTVASTDCNERSSRSHSVFQLEIIGKDASTEQETHGFLNLIDLAGSERLAQSNSTGTRLEETKHINSSLSTLAKVIQHLEQKAKSEKKGGKKGGVHVPFRDSKLTYLLQNALGGDAKTLMFCNINPSKEAIGETICSLRFASKVNNTHIGTAKKNMTSQLVEK